jgi:hypothetical protein
LTVLKSGLKSLKKSLKKLLAQGAIAAFLMVCSESAIILPSLAIIGGTATGSPPDSPANRVDANTQTSAFGGVGTLSNGCSGVAISSQHILTAAHCGGASSFNLNYGAQTSYSGTLTTNPGASFPYNDLSILTLASALPQGVPIYPIYGLPLALGTNIIMVGYGGAGDGGVGATISLSSDVKRVGENVVDGYLDQNQEVTSNYQSLFVFDFDGPDNSTNVLGAGTLGNNREATFWSGDSGSPSFILVGGQYQLVGINNFIADANQNIPLFGSLGGGVDVSQYTPWINSIISPQSVPWVFTPLSGILLGVATVGLIRHGKHRQK